MPSTAERLAKLLQQRKAAEEAAREVGRKQAAVRLKTEEGARRKTEAFWREVERQRQVIFDTFGVEGELQEIAKTLKNEGDFDPVIQYRHGGQTQLRLLWPIKVKETRRHSSTEFSWTAEHLVRQWCGVIIISYSKLEKFARNISGELSTRAGEVLEGRDSLVVVPIEGAEDEEWQNWGVSHEWGVGGGQGRIWSPDLQDREKLSQFIADTVFEAVTYSIEHKAPDDFVPRSTV